MPPAVRSLRVQLLAWILLPLAAIAAVNVWTSHAAAERMASLVTERTLVASARAIGEATQTGGGVIDAVIPPVAIEMFSTGAGDRVFYRVETGEGRLLAGYPDLPRPDGEAVGPRGLDPVSFRGRYRERALQLVALRHPVAIGGPTASIVITVGVTLAGHAAMERELWLRSLAQQTALVVVAGGLVVIGLTRGLKPLLALRDRVRRRADTDLDPFEPQDVQSELRPLVVALNQYMSRVRGQMAAQQRFVANAAHQLRTPIALLNTQATFALRTADADQRGEALRALRGSGMQLARLAHQLLTLARAEPGGRRTRTDKVDLSLAARQVLESLAAKAVDNRIDLSLEAETPVLVTGDGTMLREMMVNLVDNALTYTPAGGEVALIVLSDGGAARIVVEDTGPGIPVEERAHVFERFYRMPGTGPDGSGIGLAIVKEVADAAGGRIDLSETDGGGLTVTVTMPAASEDPKEKVSRPDRRAPAGATSPAGSPPA